MSGWVLALDLGTSGLKVGAVDSSGEIIATHEVALTTNLVPGGGVEQDPDEWWRGVVSGVRHLDDAGVPLSEVIAVGITGQYGSTVPVDGAGRPVGPCLVWADERGAPHSRAAFGGPVAGYKAAAVAAWLRYSGGLPSPNGADPSGHALYLRRESSQIYDRACWLLEPVDFLGLRFTGVVAGTPASMVATWLTDNRPGAEPRYVPQLVRMADRELDKLPPLRPSGSLLGEVSHEAAAELGIPAGVPVACGVPDLQAAHAGSGAVSQGQAHFAISTTAWVSCAVSFKKTDVFHQIASVPGLQAGEYLLINNQETAGASLQWLRDGVLGPGPGLPPDWHPSYDDLVGLAATAEPGSGGVLFTPWLNGERSPVDDRRLRAAFLNVSLDSDRADFVRAVLEGVAYDLRWLVEAADGFVGSRLDPLRVLGGGARSDLWCQIDADVLGRTVERVSRPEVAQLRGVAFIALVATGQLSWGDLPSRVPVDRTFTPDPHTRATYDQGYQAFRRAHHDLKGWYRRVRG
ncbi:MAG: FGGY-family carbohydrate kinase [Actinomycetes bacterium]